jgi:hypothetical protein
VMGDDGLLPYGTSTKYLHALRRNASKVYSSLSILLNPFKIMMSPKLLLCLLAFISRASPVDSFAVKSKKASAQSNGGGFGQKEEVELHSPDTSGETQKLLQFLQAQKATGLKDVEIGNHLDTGVRGLFCTKKIKKGQMICKIPSDCALALSDPSKNGEDCPTMAHNGANFLTMYWDNDQARPIWAPYLDTLPRQGSPEFEPTPDFFDDEEIQLLEFPRLVSQAKERKQHVAQVAGETGIDAAKLQYATWLAASRSFEICLAPDNENDPKLDEKGQVIAKVEQKTIRVMVPFIDVANHSSDQPNAKLTLIDPEKDDAWFALEASRPITAGKEILIAYGNGVKSSVELLRDYGFVPKSNPIDSIMLGKGGDDSIASQDGWTTTLEEDKLMQSLAEDDPTLKKILDFRVKLKEAYKTE